MDACNSIGQSREHGFCSTHWTTVRDCAGNDEAALIARETLCRMYWYPLYAYIKRSGLHNNDEEDLTQEFFADILRRPWFSRADQSKGKFRSFLLASLNHFLRDVTVRKRAAKRGGSYRHIPLNSGDIESREMQGAAPSIGPVEIYEVEWASALVSNALQRLTAEYATARKQDQFERLKVFLTTDGNAVLYEAAAISLGTSAGNVKAGVHRLRKRYGVILREEVARTVGTPEDVEGEVRHIREILSAN